jgi:exodeoxyribonuclease VII small subunit
VAEPAPQSPTPVRFEEGLARLERLVHDLEDGQLGLEDALRAYEEGIGLLRHCHSLLSEAERKIEILAGFDADGNAVTRPFPTAPSPTAPAAERRPPAPPPAAATREGEGDVRPENRPRPARPAPRPDRSEDEGPRLF